MSARASEVSHRSSNMSEAPVISDDEGGNNANANIMLSQRGEVNVKNQGLNEEAEQVEMQPVEIEAEMQFPAEADIEDNKDDAVNNASTGLKYTPVNDEAFEQAEQDN